VALYEPRASFVQRTGQTLVGRELIRQVLGGLIAARARFQSRVVKVITVDDVALLYTDFQGTTVDASGTTVEICHNAIEVLRRGPDGTWQLIVGDPNGRASSQ
jgi:ketosteroid isomerase-like protein